MASQRLKLTVTELVHEWDFDVERQREQAMQPRPVLARSSVKCETVQQSMCRGCCIAAFSFVIRNLLHVFVWLSGSGNSMHCDFEGNH